MDWAGQGPAVHQSDDARKAPRIIAGRGKPASILAKDMFFQLPPGWALGNGFSRIGHIPQPDDAIDIARGQLAIILTHIRAAVTAPW